MPRALLLAILSACAAPDIEVSTSATPGVDWAPFKTYAWMPRKKTGDKRVDESAFQALVEAAIEEQLKARGFTRDDKNPAIKLSHLVVLQRETRTEHMGSDIQGGDTDTTTTTPYYGSKSGRPAEETYVRGILYGTLVLNVFEAANDRRLWQGRAKAQLYTNNNRERTKRRVRDAAERMLKGFPPQ